MYKITKHQIRKKNPIGKNAVLISFFTFFCLNFLCRTFSLQTLQYPKVRTKD